MEFRHIATMAPMATHKQLNLIFLRVEKSKVLLPSCRQGVSGTKQQHGGTWPGDTLSRLVGTHQDWVPKPKYYNGPLKFEYILMIQRKTIL
jgi:hypothetical protein